MYFSIEIDSNLPTMKSKEDVIEALKNMIVVLSEQDNKMGSIKDAYGTSVGTWLLTK